MPDLSHLPDDLPAPHDDGAADHLAGMTMPSISLPASDGTRVDLAALTGLCVVYLYPMTGRDDRPLPDGWDGIPGARGCTPQACAFRDHARDLADLGVRHLYGVSTQSTAEQSEAALRLHLPFALLSDAELALADAARLPTFTIGQAIYLKRVTLIIRDRKIVRAFYPVFPPDRAADQVLDWLGAGLPSP